MAARPGSAWWLLRHEVRMFLYNAGYGSKKGRAVRGLSKRTMSVWIVAGLLMHGVAYALMRKLGGTAFNPPPSLVMGVTAVCMAVMTMMLSTGLRSSVEVLFERGDLDLLLSSPLSSRSIFTVRLAGIVVGVSGVYLFFLTPFAHMGLVFGQFRWLAIYPGIVSMALVCASLSMLMTLGLVRLVGVRRTRVVAQVLGALAGAFFFLVSQAFSGAMRSLKELALDWIGPLLAPGRLLGPDSLAWLPGQALMGAPWPALALALFGVAAFCLTVQLTHGFFVHGVQQVVSAVRAAAPTGVPRYHFGRSLTHAVVLKEWRLIARDPQLISQVLLQLLYMLPLCFVLFSKGSTSLSSVGTALTFLCGSLTASLAWVIIAAEDAPDLLLAAPCSQATIARAKLAAVALPAIVIVAPPLAWVGMRAPLAALLVGLTATAAVISAACIVLWCGQPSERGKFRTRAKGNFVGSIMETLNGFAWAGATFLLLGAQGGSAHASGMLIGAACAVLAAMLVLLFAWVFRRKSV
ncbi:MAG: hypothetical protein V4508_26095 [Pseudomonadota bacterium]